MRIRTILDALAAHGKALAARVGRAVEACEPVARRAVSFVARVTGLPVPGEGFLARGITRHVIAAGVLAALMVAAEAWAGPAAPLVEIAAGIAIAGVATSAVMSLVRRHAHDAQAVPHATSARTMRRRVLLAAATDRVTARHPDLLATKALQCACGVLARREAARAYARPLVTHVARSALRGIVVSPITGAVPGLGGALSVVGACRSVVMSAIFVHEVETAAVALYASRA